MNRTICLFIFLFICTSTFAQHRKKRQTPKRPSHAELVLQQYTDSLEALRQRYAEWNYTSTDIMSNPYYATLFGGTTLYDNVLRRCFSLPAATPLEKTGNGNRHIYDIISATDKALAATYTETPELILRLQDEGEIARIEDPPSQEIKPALNLTEKLKESKAETIKTSKDEDVAVDDWKIFVRKPNFWNFKAWLSLKFTQNYVSDNWYQGGEKNNSLLSELNLEANYNNKQKVTFDNKLEMKLGFQSSENDDEHKFKTNSDLIRLTNKLGLRAIKHWYYLISLQSWTQFYPGYRANDKRVYSDFMSPFESLFSIGMEYRPQFKKFWLEANLNPLALRCKYVDRGYLASSFGIDKNRRVKWSYGSNITINYNWNIVKNISWKGRIYWFTDYSLTQFEWENTFKFTINRYLNTELFLYPRFDDNRRRKEGASYWQFRELLSIGLTLSI